MRTDETVMLSHKQAAALFIMALRDPNLSQERKDRLITGWNEYGRRRTG